MWRQVRLLSHLHIFCNWLIFSAFLPSRDGGSPTLVSAELQSGSQGEGTVLEMSLHFTIPSFVGVSHNLRTGKANGQQMETSEIHSSGQFFFLCLTLANSLARNLLGGSTIPLEDDISGSQPVSISVTRWNWQSRLPFSECPHPGAIHAGHISAISGGHLGKREGWNLDFCFSSLSFICSKVFFWDSHLVSITFSLGELWMHVGPFILVISRFFSSFLLSSNGFSSGGFRCNATVGQGLDLPTPRCQHYETTQNSKIGGPWCKGCFRYAHQTSFWWELGDQTCSLWSLRHVEQGILRSLRHFSPSTYRAMFHLWPRSSRLLEMCQQQPFLGGCSCWKGLRPCRRTWSNWFFWISPASPSSDQQCHDM